MTVCWKARTVLPKLDAHALSDALEQLDPSPVVSAFELGERGLWEVEAFFATPPDEAELLAQFGVPMRVIPIEDENWIARALDGLPPVRTNRFYIYGDHDANTVPANAIGLKIEASYAFGTGHHGTTRGCLLAFEELSKRRIFRNALDLGCGTGILGMAFARLTRRLVVASDIDSLATSKSIENAKQNRALPHMRISTGNGFRAAYIREGAPYDLIFANILARPLAMLAQGLARNLRPGGSLILSGLTLDQCRWITAVYRNHGFVSSSKITRGIWATLVLAKRWKN